MTGVVARIPKNRGLILATMEQNMRQMFQGTVLAVAVGVQMLTFYSVLYA
ncbi:hypothetical protein ACT9ST_15305 [Sphingobium limneticum]|jgi:hypothetical protein|nr:hypothetical protein [Sphingobium limneticum]